MFLSWSIPDGEEGVRPWLQLLSFACLQWHLALPECVGLCMFADLVLLTESFHYCLDTQKQLDFILMLNGWLELFFFFFLLLFELSFHTEDEMDLFSNGSWFNTGLFTQVMPKYVQGDGSTWEALYKTHFKPDVPVPALQLYCFI